MQKSPKIIDCKICLKLGESSHSHLTPKFLTKKEGHLAINKNIEEQKIFSTVCIINLEKERNLISVDISSYKNSGDKIYQFLAPHWLELHIKVSQNQNDIFSLLKRSNCIIIGNLNRNLTSFIQNFTTPSKQTQHQKP